MRLRICARPRALDLKFVHDLVQAVTLAQNHEHTQIMFWGYLEAKHKMYEAPLHVFMIFSHFFVFIMQCL